MTTQTLPPRAEILTLRKPIKDELSRLAASARHRRRTVYKEEAEFARELNEVRELHVQLSSLSLPIFYAWCTEELGMSRPRVDAYCKVDAKWRGHFTHDQQPYVDYAVLLALQSNNKLNKHTRAELLRMYTRQINQKKAVPLSAFRIRVQEFLKRRGIGSQPFAPESDVSETVKVERKHYVCKVVLGEISPKVAYSQLAKHFQRLADDS